MGAGQRRDAHVKDSPMYRLIGWGPPGGPGHRWTRWVAYGRVRLVITYCMAVSFRYTVDTLLTHTSREGPRGMGYGGV